jgi:hypothetical protein
MARRYLPTLTEQDAREDEQGNHRNPYFEPPRLMDVHVVEYEIPFRMKHRSQTYIVTRLQLPFPDFPCLL